MNSSFSCSSFSVINAFSVSPSGCRFCTKAKKWRSGDRRHRQICSSIQKIGFWMASNVPWYHFESLSLYVALSSAAHSSNASNAASSCWLPVQTTADNRANNPTSKCKRNAAEHVTSDYMTTCMSPSDSPTSATSVYISHASI